MTIKLDALASWKLVPAGGALKLPSDNEDVRRVRIDLNCEDVTRIYVAHVDAPTTSQFVACVGPGLETVEFYAAGDLEAAFHTETDGGQVWLYTAELEPNVSEVPDAESFTEIHQRRARNPELEMMQLIARQNERRMDEQLAQLEALIAEQKEAANVDTGTPAGNKGKAGAKPVGGDGEASGEDEAGSVEQSGGADDDDET